MSYQSSSVDQLEAQLNGLLLSSSNPHLPDSEKIRIASDYRLIVTELLTRPDWPNRDQYLAPLGGDPPYFYRRVKTHVLEYRLLELAHAYPLHSIFRQGKSQAEIKAEYHTIIALLLTRPDWDRRLSWESWLPLKEMPPAYLKLLPPWHILSTIAQRAYHLARR